MKCPFRSVVSVRHIRYATQKETGDCETITEFAECLEHECPYYGRRILRHRENGGFEQVLEPCCRRALND